MPKEVPPTTQALLWPQNIFFHRGWQRQGQQLRQEAQYTEEFCIPLWLM